MTTTYSGIYTDAYLFDLATRLIESGKSTPEVAAQLVRTCGISADNATLITSMAFDPSRS